jgi:hypothetical protein
MILPDILINWNSIKKNKWQLVCPLGSIEIGECIRFVMGVGEGDGELWENCHLLIS